MPRRETSKNSWCLVSHGEGLQWTGGQRGGEQWQEGAPGSYSICSAVAWWEWVAFLLLLRDLVIILSTVKKTEGCSNRGFSFPIRTGGKGATGQVEQPGSRLATADGMEMRGVGSRLSRK